MSYRRKIINPSCLFFISLISVMLAGCSSTDPYVRAHFEKTYRQAMQGDVKAIETVGNNYCNGNKYTGISANYQECEHWRIRYLEAYPGSAQELTSSNDRFRGYEFARGLDTFYQHYRQWGHTYDSAFHQVLMRLKQSNEKSVLVGLVAFYTDHPELDSSGQKRAEVSKKLCLDDSLNHPKAYTFCSIAGDWYYRRQDTDSIRLADSLYKQRQFNGMQGDNLFGPVEYWTYNNSAFNLAALYLEPVDGSIPEPTSAIKLLNQVYQWQQQQCHKKLSKTAQACLQIGDEWRDRIRQVRAVKLDQEYLADRALPSEIRDDKYKLALTKYLKEKNHEQALAYFLLFERNNITLPDSMLFFKAETFFYTGQSNQAKRYYQQYLKAQGQSGSYYRKALARLNEI